MKDVAAWIVTLIIVGILFFGSAVLAGAWLSIVQSAMEQFRA